MYKNLCALVSLTLAGCSVFVPPTELVTVTASNENATIFADSKPIGTGDVQVQLARDQAHTFMASYNGVSNSLIVGRQISGSGAADLVGTFLFLVPIIGCGAPGFWELQTTNVQLVLPGETPRTSKFPPPLAPPSRSTKGAH